MLSVDDVAFGPVVLHLEPLTVQPHDDPERIREIQQRAAGRDCGLSPQFGQAAIYEETMTLPEKMPEIPVATGHPDVIRVLEDALAMARAGRLVAVGVVQVTGPHQIGAVTAGSAAMEIYVGAGMMQASVLKAMTEPQKRSPILMPVR